VAVSGNPPASPSAAAELRGSKPLLNCEVPSHYPGPAGQLGKLCHHDVTVPAGPAGARGPAGPLVTRDPGTGRRVTGTPLRTPSHGSGRESQHQQIKVLLFSIILYHNILYTLFAIILYYFSIMLIIFLTVSRLLFPIIFSKITDYYTHYFISIIFIIFYGINYIYYCNYFQLY
jgi:hypothetical protein